MQPPPPLSDEPVGHEATHLPALHKPEAQPGPDTQGWPLTARQAPPTSCVVGDGQRQLFVAAFQTEPDGVAQTHPCDPKPAVVDQEPEAHAVHGGVPLRRSK